MDWLAVTIALVFALLLAQMSINSWVPISPVVRDMAMAQLLSGFPGPVIGGGPGD